MRKEIEQRYFSSEAQCRTNHNTTTAIAKCPLEARSGARLTVTDTKRHCRISDERCFAFSDERAVVQISNHRNICSAWRDRFWSERVRTEESYPTAECAPILKQNKDLNYMVLARSS